MKKLKKWCSKQMMRRIVSALLAVVLSLGILPASLVTSAEQWTNEHIDTLVNWGVMRGDDSGNMNPDKPITRAEFVAMVNRAFGYTADTAHPFTDVQIQDWYNNDIGMAYNMGYFKGTSDTTASPNSFLTREQAVVLIGRNLLLDEKLGETLGFSDSRTFSEWSRGMVESAISSGFIGGYEDGTFKPQQNATRGEIAAMLAKAIGTMVNTSGTHELGGVYGNVMISTSGVKLKNTTIAGDLYITGGLELGDVLLENVDVLGKIIISGAGESHKGDSSIVLRNVESGELVVNSIAGQFVTLRAEGNTQIDFTNVKTSAYLDDQTAVGDGLLYIELNGQNGMNVSLAGNIEEVLNRTPESALMIAEGTAQIVTMDEKAVNSTLDIQNIASINQLNLDVATPVTGEGDVKNIFINAAGSVVDMLPDQITIRPGLKAEVNGEEMDTKDGNESSAEPRILSGYPKIKNLAPNSVEIVYSANKKGTIHWALTSLIDGPVTVEELLEVKDYNTKILQQGTINVTDANKEFRVKISNLISDGSYYVTAVLVDNRDQKSPVKHIVFTTPDGTAPAFAAGYPELTLIRKDDVQVAIMPTKDSILYYAVLPKGAAAPTVSEFKTGAVSGDLSNFKEGIPVSKNHIMIQDLTGVKSFDDKGNEKVVGKLEELKTYDLYFCLIDPDNGKDSGVKKMTVTTVDGTPPVLEEGMFSGAQKNNVSVTTSMNEVGTIYWVAVEVGADYLPKGVSPDQSAADENAMKKAIIQIVNGMGNVINAGKVAAKENTDVVLKVAGLEPEASYDIYFVAEDKAGNNSEVIRRITVNTLDVVAPTVRQEFTKTADANGLNPLPETDVRLIFSECIRNEDSRDGEDFLELYRNGKFEELTTWLQKTIQLWDVSNISASYQIKNDKGMGSWIDFSKVQIEKVDKEMVLTFKHGEAISLGSGSSYQFVLENVTDISNAKNPLKPNPYSLDKFTTVFAQVNLTSRASSSVNVEGAPVMRDSATGAPMVENGQQVPADIDMRFWMDPQSTDSVNSNVYYDIWFEAEKMIISFDLYCRVIDPAAEGDMVVRNAEDISMFGDRIGAGSGGAMSFDDTGWIYLGKMKISASGGRGRASVNSLINGSNTSTIARLNSLRDKYTYEFVIDVTEINGISDEQSWSHNVELDIHIPAGQDLSSAHYALNDPWIEDISPVGVPKDFSVSRKFIDTKTPAFRGGRPYFRPGDGVVAMDVMLDRQGTMYYVVAPVAGKDGVYNATVLTTAIDNREDSSTRGEEVDFKVLFDAGVFPPENGEEARLEVAAKNYTLTAPTKDTVAMMVDGGATTDRIKTGTLEVGTNLETVLVEGLEPLTTYFVYCILMGESSEYSDVYCFQFKTTDVQTPRVDLKLISGGSTATVWVTEPSDLVWAIYDYNTAQRVFGKVDPEIAFDNGSYSTLDALTTSDNASLDGGYSIPLTVFDQLAGTSTKQVTLEHIKMEATTDNAPIAKGSISISAKNMEDYANGKFKLPEITSDNMSADTTYYVVVAAKNALGQKYVFKAIGGLQRGDTEPPKLRKCTTSTDEYVAKRKQMGSTYAQSDYDTQISMVQNPVYTSYVYQGSAILDFTEVITLLYKDENNKKQWKYVDADVFMDNIQTTGSIRLDRASVKVNRGTISFNFHDAAIGDTITIFSNGSISDEHSNVSGQGSRLLLTFVVEKNDDAFIDIVGNVKFGFQVTEMQGDIVS